MVNKAIALNSIALCYIIKFDRLIKTTQDYYFFPRTIDKLRLKIVDYIFKFAYITVPNKRFWLDVFTAFQCYIFNSSPRDYYIYFEINLLNRLVLLAVSYILRLSKIHTKKNFKDILYFIL